MSWVGRFCTAVRCFSKGGHTGLRMAHPDVNTWPEGAVVTGDEAQLHITDCGHVTKGYKGTKQRSPFIVRFPKLILTVYTVRQQQCVSL